MKCSVYQYLLEWEHGKCVPVSIGMGTWEYEVQCVPVSIGMGTWEYEVQYVPVSIGMGIKVWIVKYTTVDSCRQHQVFKSYKVRFIYS